MRSNREKYNIDIAILANVQINSETKLFRIFGEPIMLSSTVFPIFMLTQEEIENLVATYLLPPGSARPCPCHQGVVG